MVEAFDKNVDYKSIKKFNIKLVQKIKNNFYDGLIILVAHNYFKKIKNKIYKSIKKNGQILDFKNLLKNKNYQL